MNTTRLIEAYLDGSLEKGLAEEMKIRAENDIELAELIRLHKEVNESIRDSDLENLRESLRKISSEKDISGNESIFTIRRIIQIAAICLFLMIIGTIAIKWFFAGSSGPTVFEKYYSKYEPDVITRSEKLTRNSLENAQILYQAGNYTQCAGILADVVRTDKQNYMAWFYLGLVRMELEQPNEAIWDFLEIPSTWGSPYLIHRNWYLALCFIKTGHEKEAGSLLKNLSSGKEFYSERARKILEEIRL